jgi:hypothetical protein
MKAEALEKHQGADQDQNKTPEDSAGIGTTVKIGHGNLLFTRR